MSYREPGVYLSVVNSASGTSSGVQMLPCIIGPGPKLIQYTDTIVRGSTTRDILSNTTPTVISKIASYSGGPAAFVLTTDYTLTYDSVDATIGYVTWVVGNGPAIGDSYYVTYICSPPSSQYDLNVFYSKEAVITAYGDDIRTLEVNTPVNYLSMAGQLAFDNGATSVMMCQVKCTAEVPTKTEFQVGLDKMALNENVWRIVPAVISEDIEAAVAQHVTTCSSYEERKERTAFFTVPYTASRLAPTAYTGTTGVLTVVGGYAAAISDKRKTICYPDTATRTFSDGVVRTVGGEMIMAAIAGAESAQSLAKSRTRMTITGFLKLGGVSMKRVQMNDLANCGVTILTQAISGGDITIRHGITTDVSTTQTRELSIMAISDYCAKSFRNCCEMYIGKYAITNEVLAMVKGTIESKISTLVKASVLISGTVSSIVQDSDDEDTIAATVVVYVPYPCNYIDITMYLN